MEIQSLLTRLTEDLEAVGLPLDGVEIRFAKKYSKTYYGLYYPKTPKYDPFIRLYPYRIPNSTFTYPYKDLLDTAIHEMCHHLQYSDPKFVRVRGVVHDDKFWELYREYINRAKTLGILKGDEDEESD